ncbi:MAG: DF family (seleno)protein [Candidatus Tyrphobacter sp.]
MRVEVLTFEGCPNAEATRDLVRQAMRLEGVDAAVDCVEVNSPEAARDARFLGSPSVRIEGEDVEPSASERTAYGLMCRTYQCATGVSGTPSIETIRAAIRRHAPAGESRDILRNRWIAGPVFLLPSLALVASGFFDLSQGWRTTVWVGALTAMGLGCVANAFRCRRVHCYLTGPFFLAMAALSLLYGLGVLPLGKAGWNAIGLTTIVGALALCCISEALFGRYRQARSSADRA